MDNKFLYLILGIFLLSFTSAEYHLDIYANNVNGSTGNINVYNLGDNLFRVNSTTANYEVARAEVMAWLFYGTDGSNARASSAYMSNVIAVITNDTRDMNKSGFYASFSDSGNLDGYYTGTLLDTTNNYNTSSWSLLKGNDNSYTASYWQSDGITLHKGTTTASSEIGTDTSSEQKNNPSNYRFFSDYVSSTYTTYGRAIIVAKGSINWVNSGMDSISNIDFKVNNSFPIFSEYSILLNSIINNSVYIPEENIIFNITSNVGEDRTLNNISLYINGILNETKSLTGTTDIETFTKSFSTLGNYNWSVKVCDNKSICMNSETRYFNISNVKVNSITYTTPLISGYLTNFVLNITLDDSVDLSSVIFFYDGDAYDTSIYSYGQNRLISVSLSPIYYSDTIVPFFFSLTLDDSTQINTTSINQTITSISLDDCSSYSNKIMNVSLFDELTKLPMFGNIEINYELLNLYYTRINNLNISLTNVSTKSICSNVNLTDSNFLQSVEIRYESNGYESEFYHIQRAEIEDEIILNLYDLNSSSSTQFKITYQDSNFNFVEDAIVQLQRKYISEDSYEVVEAPLTSSEGVTILHIDTNSVKYRATILKNGVLLDEFENLVFKCQSELTGECELKLLGEIDSQNDLNYEDTIDFYYSEPVLDNGSITVSYSIPSGVSSIINLVLDQKDMFSNNTLCNKTVTSSSGSISCNYSETLGESYINLYLFKDGNPITVRTYILHADSGLDWLDNNYILIVILLFSLVGMALSSPEWIIINGIVTLVISGGLWLANGLNFVMGFGNLLWLIVAGIILISKISKQEDR